MAEHKASLLSAKMVHHAYILNAEQSGRLHPGELALIQDLNEDVYSQVSSLVCVKLSRRSRPSGG